MEWAEWVAWSSEKTAAAFQKVSDVYEADAEAVSTRWVEETAAETTRIRRAFATHTRGGGVNQRARVLLRTYVCTCVCGAGRNRATGGGGRFLAGSWRDDDVHAYFPTPSIKKSFVRVVFFFLYFFPLPLLPYSPSAPLAPFPQTTT